MERTQARFFQLGLGATGLIIGARSPAPALEHVIVVPVAFAVHVTVEQEPPPAPPVVPPPVAAAPAAPSAVCPAPVRAPDRAIGAEVPVEVMACEGPSPEHGDVVEVAVADGMPAIAVRTSDGEIWVSRDDGQVFHRVDVPLAASSLKIDCAGRVWVAGDGEIAVAEPDGDARWMRMRPAGCDDCEEAVVDHLVAAGPAMVWWAGLQAATSTDGGRTWEPSDPLDGQALGAAESLAVDRRGRIHMTSVYQDRCGVYDVHTATFDALTRKYSLRVYSHSPDMMSPQSGARGWRYGLLCDPGDSLSLAAWLPGRAPILMPRFRGWELEVIVGNDATLAVQYDRSHPRRLLQLTGSRARVLSDDFPKVTIAAVDAGVRPVVVFAGRLLRWSPKHGWRLLFGPALELHTCESD